MDLYKYALAGVKIIMPSKERNNLRAENYILDQIVSSPKEIREEEKSLYRDYKNYIFIGWSDSYEKERQEWRDFFESLKDLEKKTTVEVKCGYNLYDYTSRNIIVIMPEKERKKVRAERSVMEKIISHPSEISLFPELNLKRQGNYVFLGWGDSNEEERAEWRKFHS